MWDKHQIVGILLLAAFVMVCTHVEILGTASGTAEIDQRVISGNVF